MAESLPTSETKIEKGIVAYSNSSWLRTTIVAVGGALGIVQPAVPVVVGTLDVALTIKAQQIAERRLGVLCQSWENEMQHIVAEQVDHDYLESEEFFDLVVKAWEAVKRTRHDDKIALYAKVLTGSVPFQYRPEHAPEEYLSILAELSLRELELAKALYQQQRIRPEPDEDEWEYVQRVDAVKTNTAPNVEIGLGQWDELLRACPSITRQDLPFVQLRLQRSGLSKEMSGTLFDYIGGVFIITEGMRKMMEYLEGQHPSKDL